MILQPLTTLCLGLLAFAGTAQAQTPQRAPPQAYIALRPADQARTRPAGRERYSAMNNGGFAGSSSAREIARTFGY